IVIAGCSRVGAMIAKELANEGHTVTVLDTNEENLRRLTESQDIIPLLGDGTLDEDLRRAGIEQADVFLAMEERDARNALAAQKARYLFDIPKVVCYISDPVRQEMFQQMGLEAISPAKTVSAMILQAIHR
ncbi:MAG: NAD-binding protein, partial [Dehalococcoidia bacterium]